MGRLLQYSQHQMLCINLSIYISGSVVNYMYILNKMQNNVLHVDIESGSVFYTL